MPVRVVVTLLGALVATLISVGVLSRVDGGADAAFIGAKVLVSCEEAWGGGLRGGIDAIECM